MSTAEATRDGASDEDARGPTEHARRDPPASPMVSASWLLRTASFVAVAAGAMGVIVAPGLHGNTSERVVNFADDLSAVLGYFLGLLLVVLVLWGGVELVRAQGVGLMGRVALIVAGATVVVVLAAGLAISTNGMTSAGMKGQLEPRFAVAVSAAASIAAIAAAYRAAHVPHTRAVAGILFAFAFAAIARVAAWEIATAAGESASVPLFRLARVLATAGVLFESMGLAIAVTWLATRGKLTGQLGAFVAILAAFVVTLGVVQGQHSDASVLESVLHTALADAFGVPPPYARLEALATMLVPASLLLALVAAIQPNQVAAVIAAVALALVSRGSLDAPLRALCAVVAAQWTTLASGDERAMWRTLIDDRKRRLEDL
jgi:hypothetical protein